MTPPRFPHSDIRGSRPACGSPRLFAACHVLRRFPAPRHPPFALSSLTTTFPSVAALAFSLSLSFVGERSPGYSSDSDSVVKEPRRSEERRGSVAVEMLLARSGGR